MQVIYGKILPQATEIEQALLGMILIVPEAYTESAELINSGCFYLDSHKEIFTAMGSLSSRSQPIDIRTVCEELLKTGILEDCGGSYYITSLTNSVTSAAHLTHYCRVLIEKFTSREAIRIGWELSTDGFDASCDPFELLDRVEQRLSSLRSLTEKRTYKPIDTLLVESVKHIESIRHRSEAFTGVESGFPELDLVTCGWQQTDLIILAARPSVGKTALALSMARNAAMAGNPVGLFSLEMGDRQLIQRIISSETGIFMWNIRNGKLSDAQMKHLFEKGILPLSKVKMFIDDTPAIKLSELRSKARRMVHRDGCKLIIVDYLQLMRPDVREGRKDLEIAAISAGLKGIAKELNVPVIALSQMSREVEKRGGSNEPKLSDLRESGAIEQDADVVMFLWRPTDNEIAQNPELARICNLKIEKHRNGSLETFLGTFAKETQKWQEIKILDKKTFLPVGQTWKPYADIDDKDPF